MLNLTPIDPAENESEILKDTPHQLRWTIFTTEPRAVSQSIQG